MLAKILHPELPIRANNIRHPKVRIINFPQHQFPQIFTILGVQIDRLRAEDIVIKGSHLGNCPESLAGNCNEDVAG